MSDNIASSSCISMLTANPKKEEVKTSIDCCCSAAKQDSSGTDNEISSSGANSQKNSADEKNAPGGDHKIKEKDENKSAGEISSSTTGAEDASVSKQCKCGSECKCADGSCNCGNEICQNVVVCFMKQDPSQESPCDLTLKKKQEDCIVAVSGCLFSENCKCLKCSGKKTEPDAGFDEKETADENKCGCESEQDCKCAAGICACKKSPADEFLEKISSEEESSYDSQEINVVCDCKGEGCCNEKSDWIGCDCDNKQA